MQGEKVKKEIDTDFIYNKWLRSLNEDKANMYVAARREESIGQLIHFFSKYNVEYETVLSYKRKVKEDLITEEGMKHTNKKGHRYYGWLQNIEKDFDQILTEYYDPNQGLLVENVIFQNSKFKMPQNDNIVEWVKENYGDSPDLIEQAHVMNNKLCIEYFTELERKVLNEKA